MSNYRGRLIMFSCIPQHDIIRSKFFTLVMLEWSCRTAYVPDLECCAHFKYRLFSDKSCLITAKHLVWLKRRQTGRNLTFPSFFLNIKQKLSLAEILSNRNYRYYPLQWLPPLEGFITIPSWKYKP